MAFNGLGLHLGNLSRLSDAESRSISPENPTGERGKGAMAIPDSSSSPAREQGFMSLWIAKTRGVEKHLAQHDRVARGIHQLDGGGI